MKKLFSMLLGVVMAGMLSAQEPVITFDKTTHDFGKINEADGRVTTVFTFKNEGMSPLVLNNVRASCGCTTPKWTKEPVEPGQTGEITVTYNPNGRPGHFQKTITVTSNAKETTSKLYIKGEVIPKTVTPVDKFPVKMEELSMESNVIDFGDIFKGAQATKTIAYTNEKTDSFYLAFQAAENYIVAAPAINTTELIVKKGQKGDMQILLDANMCNIYGPIDIPVKAFVDGKEVGTVHVKANIVEDFSEMTEEQKANAPILVVSNELNLGTFQKGKQMKATFHISNAGQDALIIRRIVTDNPSIVKQQTVKSIKSGKKGNCQITINAAEAGNFIVPITLITNDPQQPVKKLTLRWTVEE